MKLKIDFDLSYRPHSYWPESPTREVLLSRIKGQARREIVRQILEDEGFAGLHTFLAREDLDETERKMWGSIHPDLMGGEYLPNLEEDVEIARISLKSTTFDQISVRVYQKGSGIGYRVVDEYDSEFSLAFDISDLPLTLGEMIQFLDGTDDVGYGEQGGLVQGFWVRNTPDFATVDSAFYPELSIYYEMLGESWATVDTG